MTSDPAIVASLVVALLFAAGAAAHSLWVIATLLWPKVRERLFGRNAQTALED